MDNKITYINILGGMIYNLKLSGTELLLYALIYGYTQDGKNEYHGSLSYIQAGLQVSRPTAIKAIKGLIKKGFIIKTKESFYKASKESLLLASSKETLPVNKTASKESLLATSKESLPLGSKETLPNIYNNKHNNIYNIDKDKKIEKTKVDYKYTKDSFEYKTALYFIEYHKKTQTPSVLYQISKKGEDVLIQDWASAVEKLKRIDKYSEKQIKFIIDFTINDDFWSRQILSLDKFRKKNKQGVPYFVVMIEKARNYHKKQQDAVINIETVDF